MKKAKGERERERERGNFRKQMGERKNDVLLPVAKLIYANATFICEFRWRSSSVSERLKKNHCSFTITIIYF